MLAFGIALITFGSNAQDDPAKHRVVYKGDKGPGVGKNIVFIATDHEYRGEESLPALARIMARRYGFTCTVVYALDSNGYIYPGSSNVKGLDVLDKADLMVLFMRFAHFEDKEMQHFENYLKRGGPIVAFRTSTHAFEIKNDRNGSIIPGTIRGQKRNGKTVSANIFWVKPGCRIMGRTISNPLKSSSTKHRRSIRSCGA